MIPDKTEKTKAEKKPAKSEKKVGGIPWKVLRIKMRNPNLQDLPDFIATLSREEKLGMLYLMEGEFARQHYYLNKFVPESYKNKAGKPNLVQLSYDQLKTLGSPKSTTESKREQNKA